MIYRKKVIFKEGIIYDDGECLIILSRRLKISSLEFSNLEY